MATQNNDNVAIRNMQKYCLINDHLNTVLNTFNASNNSKSKESTKLFKI